MVNQKRVFWEALILSIFVFAVGVALGFMLESLRADKVADIYANSEIGLLDVRLQSQIYELNGIDCKTAAEENIRFGDSIYEEAKTLARYEEAQRLSESLTFQHKRFDILRMLFWINSIKIKERCNNPFHTITYIYDYEEPTIDQKAKQAVFSKVLGEVKETKASEVMLIPIAGDLNISSVELIKKIYGIEELPTILIDEKIKITSITSKEEILELLE
ncbi:hypothetical protein J4447_02805 [Candidatus Pacearchaeota archaeon]|nr:hypothetical protein [Candidatus Pacearchaeota archaeon]